MQTKRITAGDKVFMNRALTLAARARGRTSPNPMVGAVLVTKGKVVAEDYHKRAGTPHAEALAITEAGNKARGSTLYVTLEPCCHTDKRTPPCTNVIVAAGIKKVFVAMRDPNPKVAGKGIAALKARGIEVEEGLFEKRAQVLNEAYVKYITTGTPFVILKVAMTLDGKIATPEGQSRWITGEKARAEVHRMRGSVDAIMTAVGTVKVDNPELTARIKENKGQSTVSGSPGAEGKENAVRILIDPCLESPLDSEIFNSAAETIVVAGKVCPEGKKQQLQRKGVKIIECGAKRTDLNKLMRTLGDMGITSIMTEAGASFNASVLEAGIVDKIVFFIAPKMIRGTSSIPAVGGRSFMRLEDAHRIRDMKARRLGDDLMIEGYLVH